MSDTVLVLRTCGANMQSHDGFRWPVAGPVECPDWSPEPVCGHGLHGLLWGEGDGNLLNWSPEARWLIVAVKTSQIVDLAGKIKFPRGEVVYCGDRHAATTYLAANGGAGRAIVGITLTGGHRSTLTGGYRSTLTGGDESTLTGGHRSTLTGGYRSTLVFRRWDAISDRNRLIVAYVGENGILPGMPYRLNINGVPVVVQD